MSLNPEFPGAGEGTELNPYIISTAEDFVSYFNDDSPSCYLLSGDVDASALTVAGYVVDVRDPAFIPNKDLTRLNGCGYAVNIHIYRTNSDRAFSLCTSGSGDPSGMIENVVLRYASESHLYSGGYLLYGYYEGRSTGPVIRDVELDINARFSSGMAIRPGTPTGDTLVHRLVVNKSYGDFSFGYSSTLPEGSTTIAKDCYDQDSYPIGPGFTATQKNQCLDPASYPALDWKKWAISTVTNVMPTLIKGAGKPASRDVMTGEVRSGVPATYLRSLSEATDTIVTIPVEADGTYYKQDMAFVEMTYLYTMTDQGTVFTYGAEAALNARVRPTVENGRAYYVTVAGVLGEEPNVWPTTLDDLVVSGTVTMITKPLTVPLVHGPMTGEFPT